MTAHQLLRRPAINRCSAIPARRLCQQCRQRNPADEVKVTLDDVVRKLCTTLCSERAARARLVATRLAQDQSVKSVWSCLWAQRYTQMVARGSCVSRARLQSKDESMRRKFVKYITLKSSIFKIYSARWLRKRGRKRGERMLNENKNKPKFQQIPKKKKKKKKKKGIVFFFFFFFFAEQKLFALLRLKLEREKEWPGAKSHGSRVQTNKQPVQARQIKINERSLQRTQFLLQRWNATTHLKNMEKRHRHPMRFIIIIAAWKKNNKTKKKKKKKKKTKNKNKKKLQIPVSFSFLSAHCFNRFAWLKLEFFSTNSRSFWCNAQMWNKSYARNIVANTNCNKKVKTKQLIIIIIIKKKKKKR